MEDSHIGIGSRDRYQGRELTELGVRPGDEGTVNSEFPGSGGSLWSVLWDSGAPATDHLADDLEIR